MPLLVIYCIDEEIRDNAHFWNNARRQMMYLLHHCKSQIKPWAMPNEESIVRKENNIKRSLGRQV